MIRAFGLHIFKVNQLSSQRFEIVRKICTNGCVQLNKSKAEELRQKKLKDERDKEMRWTKLYHFTDMKYHAIVTRLKIYPLFTTIIGTPVAYMIEVSQMIEHFSFVPCLAFGFTGTATLSMYSAALANTIGIIYVCKDNKNLQIGYIDFMGKQNFIETTVDELIKWEKSPVKFGYYKTVKALDGKTEKLLKIPWKTGDVYNTKLFRRCFGK